MRRLRGWLIACGVALALFVALVALSVLLPTSPDRLPGSFTNPRSAGAQALGQVLGANGVAVSQITTLEQAAASPAGSTLAVYLTQELSAAAAARLADVPADLVIVYAGGSNQPSVAALTGEAVSASSWWSDDNKPAAGCDDPDATAAGRITAGGYGLTVDDGRTTACFGDQDGDWLFATGRTDRHRFTVIAGGQWLHNDTIATAGNAALALRVLGRERQLRWYLPSQDALPAAGTGGELDVWALLPGWFRPAAAMLLVAGAAAALWRGRRFGALVPEPLPVEVPAAEVSSGLARLYRQAGARGHAAAGLRAATVHRLAPRLGLAADAPAEVVVERLSRYSGEPPERVRALCYGPAPASDPELTTLATDLSDLEKKADQP